MFDGTLELCPDFDGISALATKNQALPLEALEPPARMLYKHLMPTQYTLTAKLFHWGVGLLIVGMLCVGLYMRSLPMGPDKLWLIGLHKSTGALILVLVALRLLWRLAHAVPDLPAGLPRIYHLGARGAHYTLYALMLAMPLSGWLMSSAAGFPVSVYGLFRLPNLIAPDKALGHLLAQAHEWMAYALIALLVLHVVAALWHQFVRRDNLLKRMWFAGRMKRLLAALAFVLPLAVQAAEKQPVAHYVLVPEQSKLKFVAIQNSAPVEGAFKNFSADIYFSPDDHAQDSVTLEHSRITAEVDMASVFAAYPALAEELKKPDWFDVAHFPKATLKTTTIKMMPDRPNDDRHYYYADSDLTIRDKTVKVELDFTLERLDSSGAVADGRITLKRRDFGVGQGKWQSADEVDDVVGVTFHVVAKRVNP